MLLPLAVSRPEWFILGAEWAATFIEGTGILIILIGGLYALASAAAGREGTDSRYRGLRRRLGRAILLGLEFLVAADIIGTVLVNPTLASAASLGLIVLIRTFLSWSLELEIDGRWPWDKQPPAKPAGPDAPSL